MTVSLVEPSQILAASFQKALEEQGIHLDDQEISEYIKHSKDVSIGENLKPGEVRRTEYWLQENGRYFGRIQIRKKPSGRFPTIASHVYYEIRPSEQNRGYGTMLLALGIEKARELGMDKLIIASDETNVASRKIIEQNGGLLEKKVPVPDSSTPIYLYAINL